MRQLSELVLFMIEVGSNECLAAIAFVSFLRLLLCHRCCSSSSDGDDDGTINENTVGRSRLVSLLFRAVV